MVINTGRGGVLGVEQFPLALSKEVVNNSE